MAASMKHLGVVSMSLDTLGSGQGPIQSNNLLSSGQYKIPLGGNGSDSWSPIAVHMQAMPPPGAVPADLSVGLQSPADVDAFTADCLRTSLMQDSFMDMGYSSSFTARSSNSFMDMGCSSSFTARSTNSFSSSTDSGDSHQMHHVPAGQTAAELAFVDALGGFSSRDGSFTARGNSFSALRSSATPCEGQLLVLQQQLHSQEQQLAQRQLHLQLQMLALQQQQQQLQQAKQLQVLELQRLQPATLEQLVAAAATAATAAAAQGTTELETPQLLCQGQSVSATTAGLLSLPGTVCGDDASNRSRGSSFSSQQPLFYTGVSSTTGNGSGSTHSDFDGTLIGSSAAAAASNADSVLASLLFSSTPVQLSATAPQPLPGTHQQQQQQVSAGSSPNNLAANHVFGSSGTACSAGRGSSGTGTGVFVHRCSSEGMVPADSGTWSSTAAAPSAAPQLLLQSYAATTGTVSGQLVAYSDVSSSAVGPGATGEAVGKETAAHIVNNSCNSSTHSDCYTPSDQLAQLAIVSGAQVAQQASHSSSTGLLGQHTPQRSMRHSWDQGSQYSGDGRNRSSASLAAAAGAAGVPAGVPAGRHSVDVVARQTQLQGKLGNPGTAGPAAVYAAPCNGVGRLTAEDAAAAGAAAAASMSSARFAPSWAPEGWNPREQVAKAGLAGKKGTGAFIPGACLMMEAKPAAGTGAFIPKV